MKVYKLQYQPKLFHFNFDRSSTVKKFLDNQNYVTKKDPVQAEKTYKSTNFI